jgi:RsiW-degrading membrane proteinase PrsW (M82 family)
VRSILFDAIAPHPDHRYDPGMLSIALIIATAVPLLSLLVIYRLNLFGTNATFRTVILCFLWGIAAYGLAFGLHRTLINNGLIAFRTLQRLVAPFDEEILKALILIILVRRANFTYFVDGAIYGFAIGIGFAIAENYAYVGTTSATLQVATGRVLSTNLIHASASAVIGISLGVARFERLWRAILTGLVGLLVAAAIHMAFNNLVTRVRGGTLLLYAAAFGLTAALFIALAIRRGLQEGRAWIREVLGDLDRVTAQEAAMVDRIAESKQLTAPIRERFGDQKAAQIARMLVLQGRIGILRKTLDKIPDAKLRRDVEQEMAGLREEMDALRREIGLYTMLYLRNIFPGEDSSLWGSLEQRIASQQPSEDRPNLWASLEQSVKDRGAGDASL